MTVRVAERSASKLDAQVKAEELIVHTLRIASNPNVFDPAYKALTDRVIDCAVGIGQDMWEANNIRVAQGDRSWPTRYALQRRALRQYNVLLYLMTLCRRAFHLRSKKYEHWAQLAHDAKVLTQKWRDSDVRRYGRP